MEEVLNSLYSISSVPIWSALLLGLMTAISPCPMATNITAMGYISKDLEKKNTAFKNGLFYVLGRMFGYTALASILFLGADQFSIEQLFQNYGEKILGPFLLVMGVFMLGIINLGFVQFNGLKEKLGKGAGNNFWKVFLLGVIFALAFCPYSGVLFFGLLIPLTINSSEGLILPVIFAIGTGIPVIIFAWLLAYTISGVGKFYDKLKNFEFWFRKIVAVLFIVVGIYYTYSTWI